LLLILQAHGRTADIDRPLSFEAMADDIAALIKHLGIGKADVMGYSLGGLALLQANSKEEAIELVKQFLHVAGDGECELRQVFEAPRAQSAAKS
jgi:hypothetical protein